MELALYSAATGMEAQQRNLDIIANDMANVNTTAYKRTHNEFKDLIYQNLKPIGVRILGETLGITPQHLMATISSNDKNLFPRTINANGE